MELTIDEALKKGVEAHKLQQIQEADKLYTAILQVQPKHPDANHNMGVLAVDVGKVQEALPFFKAALEARSSIAQYWLSYIDALIKLGQIADAKAVFSQAKSKGASGETFDQLGTELSKLSTNPQDPPSDLLQPITNLYMEGQLQQALSKSTQMLERFPNSVVLYNIAGASNAGLMQFDAAIDSYKQALSIKPDYAEAYSNMGAALYDKGDLEAAIDSHQQALKIKPDFAEAHYNLSFPHLLRGSLEKGFNFYEWRLRQKKQTAAPARSNLIWDGEKSLSGKHFVIYDEQGLGDMIQFCRYLPLLEQKGANITFKVKPNLHALLQTMDSNSRLVTSLPEENEIDFEAPLMSIPHLLNTSLETIPATNPYLFADQEKVQTWGERFSTDKFKVGICWQGSKLKADIGRSFPLSLFEGISRIPNVELISLHKGEGEDQIAGIDFDVTTLGHDFDAGQDAFLDTIAVMMNCNLIITCDTAVAHLAGAAGRPTWVALKHIPDWRWMLDRADSPWYPTMTLYRQKSRGDWVDVFDTIERDLSSLLLQQKKAAK